MKKLIFNTFVGIIVFFTVMFDIIKYICTGFPVIPDIIKKKQGNLGYKPCDYGYILKTSKRGNGYQGNKIQHCIIKKK